MTLNTTQVLEALRANPGAYVVHNAGTYRLKNADGTDMVKTDGGRTYFLEPSYHMMDDLMDAGRLKKDGQKYRLA